MHVISYSKIRLFAEKHADSLSALSAWYQIVSKTDFSSFNQLRQAFPSADQVERCTVFNIGGNKYRLIAAIHYNRKKIYIRNILTHAEYDKEGWKAECQRKANE